MQIINKKMVVITIFSCIILILQSYYTDSDVIELKKIDDNYLEQQLVNKVDINIDKKKQSNSPMEVIKIFENKPKTSNLDQKIINTIEALDEQKNDDIDSEYIDFEGEEGFDQNIVVEHKEIDEADIEYIDFEDSYAEPKSRNQEINSIEPVEVVNFTSDYEKDVLKQLMEYEEPKKQ